MASWSFSEIGLSVTKSDAKLKEQFLDCLGFEKIPKHRSEDPYYDDEYELLYEKDDMIFGESKELELTDKHIKQYFEIVNLLFPGTYLHSQYLDGTSVTCCRTLEQYLFDPFESKVKLHFAGEDNGYVVQLPYWCDVTIDDEYSLKEYNEMSEDEKQEIDESEPVCYWDGEKTRKYKSIKIAKKYVNNIFDESVKKGYTELSELIKEKCKDYLDKQ